MADQACVICAGKYYCNLNMCKKCHDMVQDMMTMAISVPSIIEDRITTNSGKKIAGGKKIKSLSLYERLMCSPNVVHATVPQKNTVFPEIDIPMCDNWVNKCPIVRTTAHMPIRWSQNVAIWSPTLKKM